MSYFSRHKAGFWGTIVIHAIIVTLLLIFGFFTPLPLPGEEGILVNLGITGQEGSGQEEPAASPGTRSREKHPAENVPLHQEQIPVKADQTEEEIMTQDYEKTAAVETANKKKQEKIKKEQAEQKKQEESERQRQEEFEKQRREKIAQQQREAKEKEKKIAEINSLAANAFGSDRSENSNSKSSSQGVTYPGGNQGTPNGAANSENYGNEPKGSGNSGNGPSFSLAGRNALSLPKPAYPGNEEGLVVVSVTVDKHGNVTAAEPGAQGSDTYNADLLSAAKKAALKARFNTDFNAPAVQKGTITYRFILD